jgi:hypothetical protein
MLDLACGTGELLCTWARDHHVTLVLMCELNEKQAPAKLRKAHDAQQP